MTSEARPADHDACSAMMAPVANTKIRGDKMKSTTSGALCLALALLAGASPAIQAQSYPARAVRLLVPFSPGGAADVPGRILGDRVTQAIGQQVVIENRPGAGSTIGAEA